MKKFLLKYTSITLILILSSPKIALSNTTSYSPIIISEIGAHEKNNFEWIEIYNPSQNSIDLEGWKFYENSTNHLLKEFQGDLIIEPQEYAIIADVAENFLTNHPNFKGTIIDSSWSSLKEAGEEIGLKDANGELVEIFTYPEISDHSLQKINLTEHDYSSSNWQEHHDSDSAGYTNKFKKQSKNELNIIKQSYVAGSLVINEIMPDPQDGQVEWIELFNNNSETINLQDWYLEDGSGSKFYLEGSIGPKDFYLYELPKARLNNQGDALYLFDPNGYKIDYLVYGNWNDDELLENNADQPQSGESLARIIDGGYTNNNAKDFLTTTTPTKGLPNIINRRMTTPLEKIKTTLNNPLPPTKTASVKFNEIYPNPPGSDRVHEFIELKNFSEDSINLNGWKIKDANGFKFTIKQIKIAPQQILLLKRSQTNIALDNDQEELKLYNEQGKLVDRIGYKFNFDENYSYQLLENKWLLTQRGTPGLENQDFPINKAPIIKLYCPQEIRLDKSFNCDASDSYDPNGDSLRFRWHWGEKTFVQDFLKLKITDPQEATLALEVTDGRLKSNKIIKFQIKDTKNSKNDFITQTNPKAKLKTQSINQQKISQVVKIQGTISVAPDVFSKNYIYLSNPNHQVYLEKGEWPELQEGDLVTLEGQVSQKNKQKIIRLKHPSDLTIISNQKAPQAQNISIANITSQNLNQLVNVLGKVKEKSSNQFILTDSNNDLLVFIKRKTKISLKNITEGQELKVSGIIVFDKGRYQLWPRSQEDIIQSEKPSIPTKEKVSKPVLITPQNKDGPVKNTLFSMIMISLLVIGISLKIKSLSSFKN